MRLSAVQIVPLDPEPMRRERPNVTNAKLASIRRLLGSKDALIAKRARHMKVLELLFAPAAKRGAMQALKKAFLAKLACQGVTRRQQEQIRASFASLVRAATSTALYLALHA